MVFFNYHPPKFNQLWYKKLKLKTQSVADPVSL